MGEVYEAMDQESEEHVALKLIRPEMVVDPHALQRFRREVHLAKKVTHPNVCRTFDIFRDSSSSNGQDLVFVSMELLSGENLSQFIKRKGRIGSAEALPLITQMAAGMGSAHRVGVVHRDFKPGNIVLVDQSDGTLRAVITDFGLALRSGGDATTLNTTGSISRGIVGTPAYMAPEQIEGRAVTAATDIYALGLVIYEMLNGSLPNSSDSPVLMALRRAQEPMAPLKPALPGLDSAWESAILRCLEIDPAKRFLTANDLVLALNGDPNGSISAKPTQHNANFRAAFLAVFSGLAILGATIGFYVGRTHKSGAVIPISHSPSSPEPTIPSGIKPRPAVAVLGFRNLSGNVEKEWISVSLTEAVNSELSQGGQVRIISGESVARVKKDLSLPVSESYSPQTLLQIRQNVSADYVILGSFLDLGKETHGQIRVDAHLQDARSGEMVNSLVEVGSESNLNDLFAKTGDGLRKELRIEAVSPRQEVQSRASRPADPDAARYYFEGLAKLQSFDSLGARDSFEMSISKESTFALSHAALATAWANLGYDQKAQTSAAKAVELSTNLSDEDRLWIEGQYHSVAREGSSAVVSYQTLFTAHPDNIEYGLRLAEAQVLNGTPNEAQNTLQAIGALPIPAASDPRIDLAEANVARGLGNLQSALSAAKNAEQKAESDGAKSTLALALMREATVLESLGKFDDSRGSQRKVSSYLRSLRRS